MSVAFVVPGLSPPPPEPPPKDYLEKHSFVQEEKRDDKIRARMEACKQGMMQLDALRSKHQRLMQQMRGRLPPIPGCAVVQARIKKSSEPQDRCSLQSVDSAISTNTMSTPSRSSSPSISHRSSVSCDSGCSSVYSIDTNGTQPTIPYSTYRKLSVEERGLPAASRQSKDIHQSPLDPAARSPLPIVVTTIASTTSLEGAERHWRRRQGAPRPRSMYEKGTDQEYERESILDSVSFSQITPPPIHRKMGIAQPPPPIVQPPHSPLTPLRFSVNASPQSPQRPLRTAQKPMDLVVKAKAARVQSPEAVFHASCIFVDRSPPSDRRRPAAVRPRSLFASSEEEPLYATPARVLVRDRTIPPFAQSTSRRTAFSPVVSRIVSTYAGISEKASRGSGKMLGKEWRESERL